MPTRTTTAVVSRSARSEGDDSSETSLVHAAKLGDSAAFEALINRYSPLVYRVVRNIASTHEDAEDLVQEAFLRAFQHLQRFEERARFSTWVCRIAIHAALLKVTRARRFVSLPIDNDTDEISVPEEKIRDWRPNPEQRYSNIELGEILRNALASLPEIHRLVFVLRDMQEISVSETAAMLGISESNVKVRLHRARLQLREQLGEHFQSSIGSSDSRKTAVSEASEDSILGSSTSASLRSATPSNSMGNDTGEINVPEEICDWRPIPEQRHSKIELGAILRNALASLPEIHRLVFVLRDIREISATETATMLGISVANVKVRLHRARLQLREQLGEHFQSSIGSFRSREQSISEGLEENLHGSTTFIPAEGVAELVVTT